MTDLTNDVLSLVRDFSNATINATKASDINVGVKRAMDHEKACARRLLKAILQREPTREEIESVRGG